MDMDFLSPALVFIATALFIILAINLGYIIGSRVYKQSHAEKESPASAISSTVLGLLAFILAFTFGVVTNRFDTRRELTREDANAIRNAWLRAEFLPEADQIKAKALMKEYVDIRIAGVQSNKIEEIQKVMQQSAVIHRDLWKMAVENARKDMNSDVAALYIESINELINYHALRISVGLQTRIPQTIWNTLYILIGFSMMTVGYQTAIAGSKRSWTIFILAISFALVVLLIVILDRPGNDFMDISQQPLINLQSEMESNN